MDIAKYLALGDRFLSDSFYFTVEPLTLAIGLVSLVIPPWIGARYAGFSGLATVVSAGAVLLACSAFFGQPSLANFDEDGRMIFERLLRNLAVISAAIFAASSIFAALWLTIRSFKHTNHSTPL